MIFFYCMQPILAQARLVLKELFFPLDQITIF